MNTFNPAYTALVVIDVQCAFDLRETAGKRRNNPNAVVSIGVESSTPIYMITFKIVDWAQD